MVICLSPFELPDPGLVAAACRAGAMGVLDLGADREAGLRALRALAGAARQIGVRVTSRHGAVGDWIELPAYVTTVIAGDVACVAPFVGAGRRVLAQVTCAAEARAAIAAGANGVIAKGCEAGGRVGDETDVRAPAAPARRARRAGLGAGRHRRAHRRGVHRGRRRRRRARLAARARCASRRSPAALAAAIAAMDGSETAYRRPPRAARGPICRSALRTPRADVRATHRRARRPCRARRLPLGQDAAFAQAAGARVPDDRPARPRPAPRGRRAARARRRRSSRSRPARRSPPRTGSRYPIAQGPMTRVSATARASPTAVARGRRPAVPRADADVAAPRSRALLAETRALLGDRPWGVGILGFVPPEIREEQLEVHARDRAAGRADRRRPAVAGAPARGAGHRDVPARAVAGPARAVPQGRRAPVRVRGPRVRRPRRPAHELRAVGGAARAAARVRATPSELSVLFAGGIHDARSAAMVARDGRAARRARRARSAC